MKPSVDHLGHTFYVISAQCARFLSGNQATGMEAEACESDELAEAEEEDKQKFKNGRGHRDRTGSAEASLARACYAPPSRIADRCFIASLAAARALVAGFKLAPGSTLSPMSATRLQCVMAS